MKKIKTLFYEIDEIINANNGEGKLIALGSRPRMGKTTFLLDIMLNTMMFNDIDVLLFSLEMSKSHVTKRLLTKEVLTDEQFKRIHIDETSSPNIDYIENVISGYNNLRVIFLDYIELVKDYNNGKQLEILSQLKNICRKKGITLIYTCQLSRKLEGCEDKHPHLSDFNGAIVKTSDAIFSLYRSSYYGEEDSITELRLSKNITGGVGIIPIIFDEKSSSFYYDVDCSFDKAPKKRVELHLHTKMSDDISTISVSDAFEFAENCNHKAIAFTNMNNVHDFPEIEHEAKKHEDIKAIYGADIIYETNDGGPLAVTLLVKNQKGVKELYHIISSMTEMGNTKIAHISAIEQNRENLLCGASGDMSKLFFDICEDKSYEEIVTTALQYDYFEIFPTYDIDKRSIYRKIVDLGKELNIPVVATGNCHYYSKEDEICRRVIQRVKGIHDDNDQLYLRNTEEMLEAFGYLGEEDAYQVVVENTNNIADLIETVAPLSHDFPIVEIPNADDDICIITKEKAHSLYGETLPPSVEERLNKELELITKHGYSSIYILSSLLTKHAHDNGYQTMSRGSIGSSFVAFLLGITNVNPLPPHYYCNDCGYSNFTIKGVASGYDLPDKRCHICGKPLKKEGQNIPYETLMGYNGSKMTDIDVNFPASFREEIVKHLADIFGEERVFLAGSNSTIHEKSAYMYVKMYQEITGEEMDIETEAHIINNIQGIKRQESIHPGGVFVLPKDREIYNYSPYRSDDKFKTIKRATHFDFHALHDNLYEADILGCMSLEILSLLKKYTGISPEKVNINDQKIYSLFKDSRSIGIDSDEPATIGLPEFGTDFVRNMIKLSKPQNFSDLVKISGLSHGTNVWIKNAEDLLSNHICKLKDLAATRDDVFNYLVEQGVEKKPAFEISEAVRKGIFSRNGRCKGIDEDPKIAEVLTKSNIAQWYIDSLRKIRYMFPKAHAVENVKLALILGWYKVYYPIEFYVANLNVYYSDKKYPFLSKGRNNVKGFLIDLLIEDGHKYTQAKKDLALFEECADRGIEFERTYIKCDGSELYSIKDGKIIINY